MRPPIVYSPHDHQLVLCSHVERPTITVELYIKWYSFYLVHPHGEIGALEFHALEPFCESAESAYRDHTPNPAPLRRFAEHYGWDIDSVAEELIEGRWLMDARY